MEELVFRKTENYNGTLFMDFDIHRGDRVIPIGYLTRPKRSKTWNVCFAVAMGAVSGSYWETTCSEEISAMKYARGAYRMAEKLGFGAK